MPATHLVLLVEDDETQRLAATWTLEGIVGPECRLADAADLAEARDALGAWPGPVLLLCDRQLPDGDGATFAVEAATRPGVRAVLLTAEPEPGPIPGIEVMEKPLDLQSQKELFAAIVNAWLSGAEEIAALDNA